MPVSALLAYLASAALVVWGGAHLGPTRAVVASFGDISLDNRRVLAMEWIAEGVTHISLGVIVILTTAVDGTADPASRLVYRVVAGILVALAALTVATGARTRVVWFRICPLVLTSAAALLVAGSLA
jgi:hypothetical protein